MNPTVGFIGLGNLGTPIALNLMENGHALRVYNRTASKMTPLTAKGATACDSISALAKECSIVFTIVSDDAALKQICGGDDGLLKNLKKGSIHISMSTILPKTAEDLAQLHQQNEQQYLASPVFGRPEAAVAKKLNFVVSGHQAVRQLAAPLLREAGGMNVWDFGPAITAANTIKLCGNFLIGSALEAIGESIHLAKKSGADAQLMWQMFSQTLFSSPVYTNYSAIILQEKFEPAAFTVKLGMKDMNLVLQQAAAVDQQMPLAELIRNNMETLIRSGKENMDWSAVSTAASGGQ